MADHFAFSVDSSCIIISGKKDNLEKLTEIFEKNFRIRSVPFDFEKNFRKFWSNGTRPKFPQNGTKSDNLQTSGTTSDFPHEQIVISLENQCIEPKCAGSKRKFVARETSHSYLHVFWRDAPAKFNQFF